MQKYVCSVCGAELSWDPGAGALLCKYCGTAHAATDFVDNTTSNNIKDEALDAAYTNAGQN